LIFNSSIMYPKPFQKLINNFSSLPSIGPKMAERLVLFLFKQNKEKIKEFSENLENIQHMKICEKCFNIAEEELCEICNNLQRNKESICVVEEPLDIISLEKTGAYRGLYHVLGGVIFSDSKQENDLRISQLLKRVLHEKIKEVILAMNPTTEGDTTSLYLKRKLEPMGIKITQLARGLSSGGDIEYTDEITLSEAMINRKELS